MEESSTEKLLRYQAQGRAYGLSLGGANVSYEGSKSPALNGYLAGKSYGSSSSASSSSALGGGGALAGLVMIGIIAACFNGGPGGTSPEIATEGLNQDNVSINKRFATVTTKNLNLRSCASADSQCPPIAVMPRGYRSKIVGSARNGWVHLEVVLEGRPVRGFAKEMFLSL